MEQRHQYTQGLPLGCLIICLGRHEKALHFHQEQQVQLCFYTGAYKLDNWVMLKSPSEWQVQVQLLWHQKKMLWMVL